jgi:hypothetical protein
MSGLLKSIVYCSSGFFLGALYLYAFLPVYQPKGTYYGSNWHAWRGHDYTKEIHKVRAIVPESFDHINCEGYVCKTCGFVLKTKLVDSKGEYIPDLMFGPIPKWTTPWTDKNQ